MPGRGVVGSVRQDRWLQVEVVVSEKISWDP